MIDDLASKTRKKGLKSFITPGTDLSLFICTLIENNNMDMDWIWVKSHQDRDIPYHHLSLEAKLNVEADDLAALGHSLIPIPHDHLSGSKISVWIHDTLVSDTNMRQTITFMRHSKDLKVYQQRKFGWSDSVMDYIDWK